MTDERQDFLNPVGEQLKAAREAKGLSLDDVATQTRIPIRHLQHIERGEWDALPAVTYSVGFARSYANAVGLDGNAIGQQVREQLGGAREPAPAAAYYEAADPARVPPKSLAIVAGVIALLLVAGYGVWRSMAVDGADQDVAAAGIETQLPPTGPVPPPPAAVPAAVPATGQVVLTATDDVWLRVYEADGKRLHEATLKAGESYEVPGTAQRPQIITGRPDALRVTVGGVEVAPLGPPERTIADVSLLPADLAARAPAAAPTATQSSAAPVAAPIARPPSQ
jgi:cytoskeleton protein RodZ